MRTKPTKKPSIKKKSRQGSKESVLTYAGKSTQEAVLLLRHTHLRRLKSIGAEADTLKCGTYSKLIHGDNLNALHGLRCMKDSGELTNSDGTDGVRIVYIDPPFSTLQTYRTKGRQRAYEDHLSGSDFIEFLRIRLILLKELMADNGSIYVHLDSKMVHHIKVVMDEVFGAENFLNSIIWHYGGRGAKAVSAQFARNHDTILLYRKQQHIFNRLYITESVKGRSGIQKDSLGRWFKTAPRGDYTDKSIARLDAEGRVHRTKNGTVRIKYFLEEGPDGVVDKRVVSDVWDDIPDAMHMAKSEKSGYPTQKPEALLGRIICSSSNPGDLVLDAFSGSGTTLVTAEKLGRRWIGIDSGEPAIRTAKERLKNLAGSKSIDDPKKEYSKECSPYRFFKAVKTL